MSAVKLGPFTLGEMLGEGTTGRVVRAIHGPTGLAVAIKQIHCPTWRERALVQREVSALSRLSHRHLLPIYDQGIEGQTAWMAVELAVARWGDRAMSGSQLITRLQQVLSGLAHAHARGVIHRDLKPDNLLIAGSGVVRIADFGIANIGDDLGIPAAGTPRYMAPEQRDGTTGAQGPWTDLYALGRMVAESVSADSSLGAWGRWLSSPDPGQRPHCAAAARRALPDGSDATVRCPTGLAPTQRTVATAAVGRAQSLGVARWRPVVPPRDWRRAQAPMPPVIEGLWSVRPPRCLVGRESLQDALWQEMVTAAEPHRIVLDGAPGVGRSALASWLLWTAREVGVPALPVRHAGVADVLRDWLGASASRADIAAALHRGGGDVTRAQDLYDLAQRGTCAGSTAGAIAAWLGSRVGRVLLIVDEVPEDAESVRLIEPVLGTSVDASVLSTVPLRGARSLVVHGLKDDELTTAMMDMAPLHAGLAAELIARFGPDLSAIYATLCRWQAAGSLEATPSGLVRAAAAAFSEPEHPLPGRCQRVGALLAALEGPVPMDRWVALCAEAGVDPDAVATVPHVEVTGEGLRLTSGRARAQLVSTLSPQDCQVVVPYIDATTASGPLRRAKLLAQSGRQDQAADGLYTWLQDTAVYRGEGVVLHALDLIEDWLADDDPRRLTLRVRRAGSLGNLGQMDAARAVVEAVLPELTDSGLRFQALHVLGNEANTRGDHETHERIVEQSRLAPDHPKFSSWLTDWCICLFVQGRYTEVEAACQAHSEHVEGDVWRVRGEAALYAGDRVLAEQCAERAVAGAHDNHRLQALQLRAACRQMRGDLQGAEQGCLEAAQAGLGKNVWLQAMTNAALIAALRGDVETARGRAEDLLPRLRRLDWKQNIAYVLAILWATTEDVELAETHGLEARTLIDALHLPDPDLDALATMVLARNERPEVRRWLEARAAA